MTSSTITITTTTSISITKFKVFQKQLLLRSGCGWTYNPNRKPVS